MKKLLFVCLFVLVASAATFAQGGRPQRSPADQVTALKAGVTGITADQETKILAIYTAQGKSRDSIMAAGGDRAAMMPLRTAANAKIKAILTADQQKQFDAIPAPGRGGQGGGAPRN